MLLRTRAAGKTKVKRQWTRGRARQEAARAVSYDKGQNKDPLK